MYYNPFIAILVSSRLIKKKGLGRYLLEGLGVIKPIIISYSQQAIFYER